MSRKFWKEAADWGIHIGIAAVLAILITVFLGRFTVVEGNSMNPTLKNSNVLIIQSLTTRFGTVKQGDIVVMRIPEFLEGNKKYAIKRVIATANQRVEISGGRVFVDGKALYEGYTNGADTEAGDSPYAEMTVPAGCIYVLGDNRLPDKSRDSRVFGPVNLGRVVGKCLVRIFPFSDAGAVR